MEKPTNLDFTSQLRTLSTGEAISLRCKGYIKIESADSRMKDDGTQLTFFYEFENLRRVTVRRVPGSNQHYAGGTPIFLVNATKDVGEPHHFVTFSQEEADRINGILEGRPQTNAEANSEELGPVQMDFFERLNMEG